MMKDRELLEMAAKAAGIKNHPILSGRFSRPGKIERIYDMGSEIKVPFVWDPLDDDGDALRLAVKLGIAPIQHLEERLCAAHWTDIMCRLESYKDDPYAATRRAIVRAAAEIGKAMP